MSIVMWIKKELRDSLGLALGVVLGLPFLTVLAFVFYGDHLATMESGLGLRMLFLLPQVALGISLGSELFGGEVRRKTIRFLRRVPGGWWRGIVSKLAVLALVSAVAAVVQGLVLYLGWQAHGRTDFAIRITSSLAFELALLGFAACAFVAWIGTWLPRSGIAGLVAPILLAGLALPAVWVFFEHPYVLGLPDVEQVSLVVPSLLILVLAVIGIALSFGGGRRLAARPIRPAVLGAGVFLMVTAASYGWAQACVTERLAFDIQEPELRITKARLVGMNGSLVLSVSKGFPYQGGEPLGGHHYAGQPSVGSPVQSWLIDPHAGTWTRLDGGAERLLVDRDDYDQGGALGSVLDPDPAFVLESIPDDRGLHSLRHWFGADGQSITTVTSGFLDDRARQLRDQLVRWNSPHRNTDGASLWMRDGKIMTGEGRPHEGPRPADRMRRDEEVNTYVLPGGWLRYDLGVPRAAAHARWRVVDLEGNDSAVIVGKAGPQERRRGSRPIRPSMFINTRWIATRFRNGDGSLTCRHVSTGEKRTSPAGWTFLDRVGDGRLLITPTGSSTIHLALWGPDQGRVLPIDASVLERDGVDMTQAPRVLGRTRDGRVWLFGYTRGRGEITRSTLLELDLARARIVEHITLPRNISHVCGITSGSARWVYMLGHSSTDQGRLAPSLPDSVWRMNAEGIVEKVFPRADLREVAAPRNSKAR